MIGIDQKDQIQGAPNNQIWDNVSNKVNDSRGLRSKEQSKYTLAHKSLNKYMAGKALFPLT